MKRSHHWGGHLIAYDYEGIGRVKRHLGRSPLIGARRCTHVDNFLAIQQVKGKDVADYAKDVCGGPFLAGVNTRTTTTTRKAEVHLGNGVKVAAVFGGGLLLVPYDHFGSYAGNQSATIFGWVDKFFGGLGHVVGFAITRGDQLPAQYAFPGEPRPFAPAPKCELVRSRRTSAENHWDGVWCRPCWDSAVLDSLESLINPPALESNRVPGLLDCSSTRPTPAPLEVHCPNVVHLARAAFSRSGQVTILAEQRSLAAKIFAASW